MQWFICEYVTVGVQYMPSVAWPQVGTLAWIRGGFPLLLPFSQHLPVWHISTSVSLWFFCPAPQTMARESPPQAFSLHCCILSFGWMRWHIFNERIPPIGSVLWAESYRRWQRCKICFFFSFLFFSVCGKQWTCVTENEQFSLSTLSLYEVSEIGVSHEGWAVTVNQGLSPR